MTAQLELWLDDLGIVDQFPVRAKVLLFFKPPIQLWPTQHPIQWERGAHSRVEGGRGVKLTTHLHLKLNSVAVVRKRTIPTERPPLVGEVSANLCG
jgi:hypothetical protein